MWTEETVRELIKLYKQQPQLWDAKDKHYKNRGQRNDALKNISELLNVEVVEVERKINVLITQFRRTHKKVEHMKKCGYKTNEIEKSVWYGYKLLLFLEDKFNRKQMRTARLQIEEKERNVERLQQADDSVEDTLSSHSLRKTPPKLKERRPLLAKVVGSRVNNEALVLRKDLSVKRKTDADEYDLYGEQIALKLRKMDEFTRLETQHRINCIQHEAEMKVLKQRSTPTVTSPKSPEHQEESDRGEETQTTRPSILEQTLRRHSAPVERLDQLTVHPKTKRRKFEDRLLEILSKSVSNREEDEDRLFLLSLVSEFKKVPQERKLDLKVEIMGRIQKAQSVYAYDYPSSPTNSSDSTQFHLVEIKEEPEAQVKRDQMGSDCEETARASFSRRSDLVSRNSKFDYPNCVKALDK